MLVIYNNNNFYAAVQLSIIINMTDLLDIPRFNLIDNSVWRLRGYTATGGIAAFDLENTLLWSEAGLIYMRRDDDWVPTTNILKMARLMDSLMADNWTIVIFTNQEERNPEYTETSKRRIISLLDNVTQYMTHAFRPWVYMAIRNDNNRKPNNGMWQLFIIESRLTKLPQSFYCGDAIGNTATNPLYRWSDHDTQFAENCGLALYNPEEIVGTYTPPSVLDYNILFVMAADPSQYQDFVNSLGPEYLSVRLQNINAANKTRKLVVVGERFATAAGRNRVRHFFTNAELASAAFLLFTRPIKPFATNWKEIANVITGYANALDEHIGVSDSTLITVGNTSVSLIRIN